MNTKEIIDLTSNEVIDMTNDIDSEDDISVETTLMELDQEDNDIEGEDITLAEGDNRWRGAKLTEFENYVLITSQSKIQECDEEIQNSMDDGEEEIIGGGWKEDGHWIQGRKLFNFSKPVTLKYSDLN